MDFMTAVRTCLQKYADFTGRARRSEYWFFILGVFIVNIVASVIDAILGTAMGGGLGLFSTVASLALLVPQLAAGARRLHDTGRSGWWQLIGLIPCVGWIILIIWYATDGTPGDNEHGPNPKGIAGGGFPPAPPTGPDYGTSGPTGPNYGQ